MPTVTEYQKMYDDISEIRQAVKSDFSIPNDRKREIARQYAEARKTLKAASKAATAAASAPRPPVTDASTASPSSITTVQTAATSDNAQK